MQDDSLSATAQTLTTNPSVSVRKGILRRTFGVSALLGCLIPHSAFAQTSEPPPPPPIADEPAVEPPPAASPASAEPTFSASASTGFIPAESPPEETAAAPFPAAPVQEPPSHKEAELRAWLRTQSLRVSSTLSGSAGLMRVREAGSGAPGTFRVNLAGSYFSQGAYLCNEFTPCLDPVTGNPVPDDATTRAQTVFSLSVTPFPFMEAFFNLKNAATSNANGRPSSLQTVGEPSIGVKGFMPKVPDRIFSFGGEAELLLFTGNGGVGLSGGSTSFALRALGTLDLNNRIKEDDRIPLRAHVNLGYYFDNSAQSVASIETTAPPQGRGEPIQRPERFGLAISRVDAFEIGLGAELVHDWVRPFLEWTLDVPVNRQGYVCNIEGAASRGDLCLGTSAAFNTTPQRLTLGARVFPWQASGLSVTGALDIGTGATTIFVEELRPEMPYNLWLAIGYAVDTRPPEPVVVEAPATLPPPAFEPERRIAGVVVDEASGAPLPGAVVLFEDPGATGMVANNQGAFQSGNLAPGEYKLIVRSPVHRDGECVAVVPDSLAAEQPGSPSESAAAEAALAGTPEPGAPAPAPAQTDVVAEVTCSLKELPRVGNVVLVLVDAETGATIPGASVTITDPLNRSLELSADNQGSLQFNNVPFGTAYLVAEADKYLRTVMPVVVDSRDDLRVHVVVNRTPKKSLVRLGPTQVALSSPIQFVEDTDQVAPQSMVVVEQLAALLREDSQVGLVEIGVHSAGGEGTELALTQARADALRQILVRLGVDGSLLEAKGYGAEKPIAPGVDEASAAKNNRVEITRKK